MNKFFTSIITFCFLIGFNANAIQHEVASTGNLSYSPDVINASIGDTVNFTISSNHPTAEVSEDTWNAEQATPLVDGFGTMTSSFTIILDALDAPVLYYVCVNHIGAGMKGLINVQPNGIEDLAAEINFQMGPNPVFYKRT